MHMKITAVLIVCLALSLSATGQSTDLQKLLKDNKLIASHTPPTLLSDGTYKGVSAAGIVWLNNETFTTGTIEVDLRGKDIMQKSFLGIAFHAVDTSTYDVVYFRPFNFRAEDPVRKIHAVQYMTIPDFPWDRLRKEQNGIYEKAVTPAPAATDWFHARIVVDPQNITVYVNNASTPSLTVPKLNTRTAGRIGLWSSALPGDFANLVIHRK